MNAFPTDEMDYAFVLPTAAFLADVAVLLFIFSDPRTNPVYARPLTAMYCALMGWNLSVALMISAPDAETAWFYLFVMRHFLFLTPPCFLWFALSISGHIEQRGWLPRIAFSYALVFMGLAAAAYFTGGRWLIQEMHRYEWGYFPLTVPLARGLLGGLFAVSLLPAFYSLFRPKSWPEGVRGGWMTALFVVWWLSLMLAILPLSGIAFFPPGSGMDAIVGLTIALYLRGQAESAAGESLTRRSRFAARLAGTFAACSVGVFVTFFLLEFLLPAWAIATGLAGAITAFVALVAFQQWFAPGGAAASPASAAAGPSLPERLQSEYGLTPTEAVICRELHAGVRRDDIVRKLGVTDGTFRNHLSEVYRKTVDRHEPDASAREDFKEVGAGGATSAKRRSRDKLQRLTVLLKKIAES